jgi:cysteinyl-tRNA synthetase
VANLAWRGVPAQVDTWRGAGQLDLLARGLAVFGLAIDRARDDAPAEAHRLAVDRQAARARRDYAAADRLRVEIERSGWEQGPTGTDPITSPATPS